MRKLPRTGLAARRGGRRPRRRRNEPVPRRRRRNRSRRTTPSVSPATRRANAPPGRAAPTTTRGLACTNCHTVMRNVTPKFKLVKTATEMETCFQCHKLQRAQMQRSSHMPLREGKMTCSNCHNPHGSVNGTEAMINAAFDQRQLLQVPRREARTDAVRARAGARELPQLPRGARLEPRVPAEGRSGPGCAPSATPSRTAVRPRLARSANSIYAVGHSCNNCHSQIHGSNSPSGALLPAMTTSRSGYMS